MARPSQMDQRGFIYFIASETQNAVKIGFASDVHIRHKSLQTGNPDTLTLRAHVPATYEAELAIHRLLKSRRIRLEWYQDDDLIYGIENALQDAVLDSAMEHLAENSPNATGADALTAAMDARCLRAADVEAAVTEQMEWFAD